MKRSSLVLVLVTCRAVAQGDESSPILQLELHPACATYSVVLKMYL